MNELKDILSGVQNGGDFCAGGRVPLPNPGMSIQGVGLVAFPLLPSQTASIKSVAEQAPYGKGSETIVNTQIRNSLQVDSAKVTFANPEWTTAMRDLVNVVAQRLGADEDFVDFSLYKLLLYEAGGHFKAHRDTEKAAGMFGTLVLQFPCVFTGGALVVRHQGVERVFECGGQDGSPVHDFHFAAHFADCEHEVLPITSGERLVAVYSLCWKEDGPPPVPPSLEVSKKLAKLLAAEDECLGWLLHHQYTAASLDRLGCGALKGRDRVVADSLLSAGELMKLGAPGDELSVHVVEAQRVDVDYRQGECKVGTPELILPDGVHPARLPRPSGSRAGEILSTGALLSISGAKASTAAWSTWRWTATTATNKRKKTRGGRTSLEARWNTRATRRPSATAATRAAC
jgi:hypothetical protein